jgi:branched-chain amino acid transport system substrate-binding protein
MNSGKHLLVVSSSPFDPSRHDSPPSGAKPEPVPGDVGRQPARLRLNDCACRRKVIGVLLLGSATSAVVASGGKVLGSARHPLNTADFSAFLLQAQASGAKVVAPANAGGDMVNATKQADEFGLTRAGKTVVSLLTFITDVNSVGLKAMQGLTFITAFYWDRDDESRAWSKRFFELRKRMPTMAHAAIYSAVRHYLRAIEAAGTDEAKAVMAKMREIPVNDFNAKNGRVREDGRMVHDMYFVQVKTPEESNGPWDYYENPVDHSGRSSFSSLDEGGCPLVKQR